MSASAPVDAEETPCYPRSADSVNNSTGKVPLKHYRRQSTIDLSNRSVRANSVEEFLNGLLPFRPGRNSNLQRPTLATNPFEELEDADSLVEAEVVELFVDAVNSRGLIPGLVMARCENRPDPRNIDTTGQKIDAAFYHATNAPDDDCPHWADQAGCAEFKSGKTGNGKDPWSDVKGNPEPDAEERETNRGQAMTFAELVHAIQQRVFLFMLYVIGRRFRLLRWDRAGVIFSPLVDYFENPEPLLEFLWRLSHLGDTALGLDPSASRISHTGRDWKIMDRAAEDARYDFDHHERDLAVGEVVPEGFAWTYVREMFADSIADPEWPRYKLHVNVAPKTTRAFLVGKPVIRADGLVGPGTRWYVAFDCEERRFVWLKDSWRASYELVETEGNILATLKAAGVEHVPTLVCHGDVRKQVTLTAQWWIAQNPKDTAPEQAPPRRRRAKGNPQEQASAESGYRRDCPVRQLAHYRLVTEEVCMSLDQFQNGLQLVSLVLDCLTALHGAYENSSEKRLHRDVTDRSVLIYPKIETGKTGAKFIRWRGVLANWELSKAVAAALIARQPERNGSWQFMSVNLLSLSPMRFSIADDLESMVLVLIYHAIRYLSSSIEKNLVVANHLESCFDSYTVGGCKVLCSERKTETVKGGSLFYYLPGIGRRNLVFGSPLDELLGTILAWFSSHYKVTTWEAHIALHRSLARAQTHFQTPAKSSRSHSGDGLPRRQDEEPEPPLPPVPTPEDRELATKTSAHSSMISEFWNTIQSERWSARPSDRHSDRDRVPAGWLSKLDPVPNVSGETA
ncbi:hypothetical protein GSI_05194 [Ganoderma sinense ZZ0214-1]|uniref:Fungal-type protein kinase domain-containing protein n=1 Tax=Ganoderma sinense ZZ0214-1 TaxID=1077348 RepID=A0A2G8SFH5_9APHY|nr:hypothetical protein GSI_05194 [Ganoderma sinense ZZ0214-1]